MHKPIGRVVCLVAGLGLLCGAVARGSESRPVRFTTSDGVEIVGDYYEPAATSDTTPVAILLHMYKSDRKAWRPLAEVLQGAGLAVLAIDLRGHGESGGEQRAALRQRVQDRDSSVFKEMFYDVSAAHSWLAKNPKCDVSRVALVGASVGCSVAIEYASRDRSVDVVVVMTPGLDYLGFDSTRPIRAVGDRPILLLATEGERQATDDLAEMGQRSTKKIVGPGRVHGTRMFGTISSIESQILKFIQKGMGARSEKPVVSTLGGKEFYRDLATLQKATVSDDGNVRWFSSAEEARSRGLKPGKG